MNNKTFYFFQALIALVIIVALLFAAAYLLEARAKNSPTPETGPISALDACQLPTSAVKDDTTINFQWRQVTVRADSTTESVLFFTSANNDFLCQAWRDTTGHYDSVVTSMGVFQATNGTALTYEIGIPPQGTDLAPTQLIIGQVPTGTTEVEIVTSDQEHRDATIGHGWYLAWVSLADSSTKVVEIDALGADGQNLTYMLNPGGLSVGDTAAVSN